MRALRPHRTLAAVLLALCLLPAPRGASAVPPATGTRPDDAEVSQRLDFLSERLDSHRTHAQVWKWGWTAINAGTVVAETVLAVTADDRVDRVNAISQGALAGLGLVDLFVLRPFPGTEGADPARALLDGTAEGRLRALERAEALLEASAERARNRKRWPLHLGNVAVNGVAGLAVWAAGSGTDGLVTALSGILGGEIQIWSQPFGRERDLEDYRRRFSSAPSSPRARLLLAPFPGGLALRLEF